VHVLVDGEDGRDADLTQTLRDQPRSIVDEAGPARGADPHRARDVPCRDACSWCRWTCRRSLRPFLSHPSATVHLSGSHRRSCTEDRGHRIGGSGEEASTG
jgi:hypothetical protein